MLKEELMNSNSREQEQKAPEAIQQKYSKAANVDHPRHYEKQCSMECIDSMEISFGTEAVINFCKCNAYKYLWRYKNKNGKEDLEKAMWYCMYAGKKIRELYQTEHMDEQVEVMRVKILDYMESKPHE